MREDFYARPARTIKCFYWTCIQYNNGVLEMKSGLADIDSWVSTESLDPKSSSSKVSSASCCLGDVGVGQSEYIYRKPRTQCSFFLVMRHDVI